MFAVVLWAEFSRNPSKKNNRLIEPEGDGQWREPQPIFIALVELKTLLNEGRMMLAKYEADNGSSCEAVNNCRTAIAFA